MTLSDEQFLSDPSILSNTNFLKMKKLIILTLILFYIARLPQKPAACADVASEIITTEFFHSSGKIL